MNFKHVDKNHASLHDIKMILFRFAIIFTCGILFSLLISLFTSSRALAANQLIGIDDETIVYSGAGFNYRPLYILKAEAAISVAKVLIKTKDANFYKVLVVFPDGRRAIGYIAQTANVRLKTDRMDDDDFASYSELGLSKNSISTTGSFFRGSNYLITIGLQKYRNPGFYTKYYVGEWITQDNSGHHIGVELGNDALISKQISGFVSYAGGLFLPAKDNAIFIGSKTNAPNYLLHGVVGLKFNQSGGVSFSFGGSQAVVFNQNNSFVTFGAQVSLEVGL